MRLVWKRIPVVLVLCVAAAILVLKLSIPGRRHCSRESSSLNPFLLFSLFNTVIVAIIVEAIRTFGNEAEFFTMPVFFASYEVEGSYGEEDSDDDDEYEADGGDSDGYYEDNDDNGSDDDDDDDWDDEDEDEYDENLESRIEDFIAKVKKRSKIGRS